MTMPPSLRLKQSSSQPTEQKSTGFPSTLRLKQQPKEEDFISDEQLEKDIERSSARTLSRIGETALGAPGDIASFFGNLLGGSESPIKPLGGLLAQAADVLPTSEDIREFTKKASQGYLEPEGEAQKKSDEIVSDITSMALPGAGKYNMMRNIGIPIVGNLVKEGLKYANADEKTQGYTKTGTMIALDLLSRKTGGVKKYAGSLFQKAEEAIPKGLSINASSLKSSIDKLEQTLTAGGERSTTTRPLKKITEIRNEIKDGKIDAQRLAAYRQSINEAVEELGGFNLFSDVPQKLKPKAIKNLQDVKGTVIDSLEEYGKHQNPEYLKLSRDANEAWSAYSKSNKIAYFLEKKVGYAPKSAAAKLLFSYGSPLSGVGSAALNPITAVGTVGALGGYQAIKVLERVRKSPVLREYYLNVLKNAASGNVPQTAKNLKKLDEALED